MKKNEYQKMFELENTHFWFSGKRYFIQTYLKKIKTPLKNILDVGAGTGGTTKFLEKFGQVMATEKNSVALSYAKKRGLQIRRGEVEKLPYKNSTFDLVTIFDVLYHQNVKDIDRAFREINRVLKLNGYLLLTDSAFSILKGAHSKQLHEARRFTLKKLEQTLSGNSFTIQNSSYIFISLFPIIYLKRAVIDKYTSSPASDVFKPPSFINQLLLIILKVEALLLSYLKFPFGTSLIILAKKKA